MVQGRLLRGTGEAAHLQNTLSGPLGQPITNLPFRIGPRRRLEDGSVSTGCSSLTLEIFSSPPDAQGTALLQVVARGSKNDDECGPWVI